MEFSARSLVAWSHTHQGKKVVRYTLTSGITTVISFSAVAAFYGFRIIPSVIWATLAGNLVGTVPAYNLNRRWTWNKRGRSSLRTEIAPFLAMSAFGIAFSQLGAWWAKHEVAAHHWSHLTNTGLVAGANLVCFGIFWVLKLMVFNRIFHVHRLEAIDEHLTLEERAAS
jgi:putative flippase GtrA